MKIVFLIGRAGLSGGNYVVFQHALYASEQGHDVTVATLERGSPYEDVWHPAIPKLKFAHIDEAAQHSFDIAFATFWLTALELHRLESRQYAYFVQSIESRFYPEESAAMRGLIDAVYGWSLPGVTEAGWIQTYLAQTYGSQYHLVRNGIRKDLYRVEGPQCAPRRPGQLRVLVEGPFGGIKNTARALATARRAGAPEVWLLTTSDIPWYPRVNRIFTNLPIEQVPPIYRSCDVILKLSLVEGMFGPPLEMFHCGGTAIVYDVSGHEEYIVDGRNALVARMHDETAVIESIRRLRDDPQLLARLKTGALETAADWPSWGESSSQFMRAIEALYAAEHFPRDRLLMKRERLHERFSSLLSDLSSASKSSTTRPASLGSIRRAARRYRTLFSQIMDGYR